MSNIQMTPGLTNFFDRYSEQKVILAEDIGVRLFVRSTPTTSAGIGYSSVVEVYCRGQVQEESWRFRDPYSAAADHPENRVGSVSGVEICETGEKTVITMKVNRPGRISESVFEFERNNGVKTLSESEEGKFRKLIDSEIRRITSFFRERADAACVPNGHAPWEGPLILGRTEKIELGICAFVVRSQIDTRVSGPQRKWSLYVIKYPEPAFCVRDDCSWGSDTCGGDIVIENVFHDSIMIFNRGSRLTIQI